MRCSIPQQSPFGYDVENGVWIHPRLAGYTLHYTLPRPTFPPTPFRLRPAPCTTPYTTPGFHPLPPGTNTHSRHPPTHPNHAQRVPVADQAGAVGKGDCIGNGMHWRLRREVAEYDRLKVRLADVCNEAHCHIQAPKMSQMTQVSENAWAGIATDTHTLRFADLTLYAET